MNERMAVCSGCFKKKESVSKNLPLPVNHPGKGGGNCTGSGIIGRWEILEVSRKLIVYQN